MVYCLKLSSPDFKFRFVALKIKNLVFIKYKKNSIYSWTTPNNPNDSFNSVWYAVYILEAVLLSKFISFLVNSSSSSAMVVALAGYTFRRRFS